jgi:hypothetical protein
MKWGLAGWRLRQQRTHGEQRNTSHSRPRVAQAAEAARVAQEGVGRSLGSATAGAGVMLTPVAMQAFTPILAPAFRMDTVEVSAGRGLAPELVLATSRAAQALGRAPEEVWAEALRAWLGSEGSVPRAARPVVQEVRRAHVWSQIDETLHELRAS